MKTKDFQKLNQIVNHQTKSSNKTKITNIRNDRADNQYTFYSYLKNKEMSLKCLW